MLLLHDSYRYYEVIVRMINGTNETKASQDITNLKTYQTAIGNDSYITAQFPASFLSNNGTIFTIGDCKNFSSLFNYSYDDTNATIYYNGPLIENASYSAFVRVYTEVRGYVQMVNTHSKLFS